MDHKIKPMALSTVVVGVLMTPLQVWREIIGTGGNTTTGGIAGPICGVTIKILRSETTTTT